MNKIKFFLFLLIISFFQLKAQNESKRFCKIYLKSGELIENIRGKRKGDFFTHYDKIGSKVKKIKIEAIDSVVIGDNEGFLTKYRFFRIKGKKKIHSLKIIALGSLELYKIDASSQYGTFEMFYLKRKEENEVTYLGRTKKKREYNLMKFIGECDYVTNKINNGILNFSDHIPLIINYYNINCPSK